MVSRKGQGLTVKKLVILIIVALVIFIAILAFSSTFREKIFGHIKGLPEYKYEKDKPIDMSELSKEELAMLDCDIPVAGIGGNPLGGWWEVWKKDQRNLYIYDKDKEDFVKTNLYWEGDSKESLKLKFSKEWTDKVRLDFSGEVARLENGEKLVIDDRATNRLEGYEGEIELGFYDLLKLDKSRLIPETRILCRDEEPGLSKETFKDLSNIVKVVNGEGEKVVGDTKEYVLKSNEYSLFNFIEISSLPRRRDGKEVCICPSKDSWNEIESLCERIKGCRDTKYAVSFDSNSGRDSFIEVNRNKRLYFEKKELDEEKYPALGGKGESILIEIRDYEKPSQCRDVGEVDYNGKIKLYKRSEYDKKTTRLEVEGDRVVTYNYGWFGRMGGATKRGSIKNNKIKITDWDVEGMTKEELEMLDGTVLINVDQELVKYKICEPEEENNPVIDYFVENEIPGIVEESVWGREIMGKEKAKKFYFMQGSNSKRGIMISLKTENKYPYRTTDRSISTFPGGTMYIYIDREWRAFTNDAKKESEIEYYGYKAIKNSIGEKPK